MIGSAQPAAAKPHPQPGEVAAWGAAEVEPPEVVPAEALAVDSVAESEVTEAPVPAGVADGTGVEISTYGDGGSGVVSSGEVGPGDGGSGVVSSVEGGPGDGGSGVVSSVEVGPGDGGSGVVSSGEVGPGDGGSGVVSSGEVGPGDGGSGEVSSGEVGPEMSSSVSTEQQCENSLKVTSGHCLTSDALPYRIDPLNTIGIDSTIQPQLT
ncbi:hypothetical protein NHX12_016417 [Muraenolepis orangiensis]|uniref:Uncharacterized protein n=1 Tax=Muraenolepis orangiensis TaxID=630683 RepID=A0A9Q0D4B1_9TELE|nr:hypothetical protein NHX12_016417 [Muraenolepis orangiensis]